MSYQARQHAYRDYKDRESVGQIAEANRIIGDSAR